MWEQPGRWLLLAVWFGSLAGLAEVLVLAVKKYSLHYHFLHQPLEVVWMAPLANAAFYAIPGFALFLIAWRWPRLVTLRRAALPFTFLGFFGLLMTLPFRLSEWAAALLAAGLAVQTAHVIAAHPQRFRALVRRTLAWMVALIVGLGLGLQGWQALTERRALATLPPASPNAPNVLLIVLDTVRAQSLSLYGYARPTTPQLERLARSGVRFERAIAPAPWTLPSHASMFTGYFPSALSVDWQIPLDATHPTLAEVLRAHGYHTAGFVANMIYCSVESGLNRGFIRYEDYPVLPGEILVSSSLGRRLVQNKKFRRIVNYMEEHRKSAADVNRSFLRWLSRHDRRPFFAFLNYMDAHDPYRPPKPFDRMFGPKKWRGAARQAWPQTGVPPEIQARLDAYESSIAYLDQQVVLLVAELQQRGVLENTLVIITSDHGEEFREHEMKSHGNSLYLTALHVPLLIIFPHRVPEGWSVREPVSLRDLPATVLDLLQLEGGTQFPGRSLVRLWDRTRGPGRPSTDPILSEVTRRYGEPIWYPVSSGDLKSLVVGRYHYIVITRVRDMREEEELYDVERDPFELSDLARAEGGRRDLAGFRNSLWAVLAGR